MYIGEVVPVVCCSVGIYASCGHIDRDGVGYSVKRIISAGRRRGGLTGYFGQTATIDESFFADIGDVTGNGNSAQTAAVFESIIIYFCDPLTNLCRSHVDAIEESVLANDGDAIFDDNRNNGLAVSVPWYIILRSIILHRTGTGDGEHTAR